MKLIFLDIDGVLNSSYGKEPYIADMEVSKLSLLKQLIVESKADGIVLISDRRYSKPYMKQFIDALDQFEIFMVGMTRKPKRIEEDTEDNRGKQIVDYLTDSEDDIESIVILDDIDDGISELFPDEFILVNHFYGLNDDIYQKAVEILK